MVAGDTSCLHRFRHHFAYISACLNRGTRVGLEKNRTTRNMSMYRDETLDDGLQGKSKECATMLARTYGANLSQPLWMAEFIN